MMSELTNRELDALVAEHVMGWKWITSAASNHTLKILVNRKLGLAEKMVTPKSQAKVANSAYDRIPPYASSHDHAFDVTVKAIARWGATEYALAAEVDVLENPELMERALTLSPRQRCIAALRCAEVEI